MQIPIVTPKNPVLPFPVTRTCGANIYNLGGGQLISTIFPLPTPAAHLQLPTRQCPPFAILPVAARLRRRLCSSESATRTHLQADKSWTPSPHRSLMLTSSKLFFKVILPSHFRMPLSHTTPSRLLDHCG